MIDYQEIIENLPTDKVIDLMESLGARAIRHNEYVQFSTICHNENPEEASMKLYYYENSHMFVCYTNEGAMSIFKVLKNYYETRGIAYDWYEDVLQVILSCSLTKRFNEGITAEKYKEIKEKYLTQKINELPTYSEGILDIFTKYYPVEWLNDRITPRAMDKYNIRFSTDANKIIIPHYNPKGELVGIRGRALNQWEVENIGKYMPVQIEEKWYSHPLSLNPYGLNVTKGNISKTGICFIGESEKFCLQMDNYGFPNCSVAVCGSQLNKYIIQSIIKETRAKNIVVCFDKEEKGDATEYFDKLWKMCKKYQNYADFSFLYDRENLLSLKDAPTDKGEETFKKLFARRVIVK